MVLTFFYARRAFCDPDPEYRQDTLELLQRRRFPGGGNVAGALRKGAREISHHFHPDQIARMDPILRNHLRVGPTRRRFKPLE